MIDEFERLLEVTRASRPTCSISNPKSGGLSFIKDERRAYELNKLNNVEDLMVIAPRNLKYNPNNNVNITLYRVKNVDLIFTLYHNYIYKDFDPSKFDIIHKKSCIHPTAVIGVDGIKVAICNGTKILFKHTGNVVIEEDVNISANVVVHRSRLDSTIIKRGTIIGALTNIGHNAFIDHDCVFTTNISVGGSAKIGANCWIGMGASIRNGVTICDNVVIGMSSAVVDDIVDPGFYVGNPARFLKKFRSNRRGF